MKLSRQKKKVRNDFGIQAGWQTCFLLSASCTLSLLQLVFSAGHAQSIDSARQGMDFHNKSDSSYMSNAQYRSKVSKFARLSDKPRPDSGVQLLETIFSRVMNIPQVALTKTTGSQILAQNLKQNFQQSNSGQGVDYKLAIRPKEPGKVFAAPSPSPLQMPQAGLGSIASGGMLALRQQGRYAPGAPASFGDEGDALIAQAPASAAPENWRGGALSRTALKNEMAEAQDKPGVWDRDGNSLFSSSNNSAALRGRGFTTQNADAEGAPPLSNYDSVSAFVPPASSEKKVSDLSTAVNKLFKISKNLEEAQSLGEKLEKEQAGADNKDPKVSAKSRQNSGLMIADAPQRAQQQWYNAPRELQIVDERPVVRDFRESPQPAQNYGLQGGSSSSSSLPKANSTGIHGSLMKRTKDDAGSSSSSRRADGLKNKIALLPPHVITGIPLGNVTLGKSEAQVLGSIGRIGKVKQQNIRNWTVYTWSKKDSSAEALQLFFRHGLLDGIRIFDSSLMASDFGVYPGDKLEKVKEKFGEPSFLLAEPGNSQAGKNYIYPISQVGFQLARKDSESAPLVVSVLIFSVK